MADHNIEANFSLQAKATPGLRTSGVNDAQAVLIINNQEHSTEFNQIYEEGSIVEVTAPAKHKGSSFSYWLIEEDGRVVLQSYESTISFTVTGNMAVRCFYNKESFALLCSVVPGIIHSPELSTPVLKVSVIPGLVNTPMESNFSLQLSINPV